MAGADTAIAAPTDTDAADLPTAHVAPTQDVQGTLARLADTPAEQLAVMQVVRLVAQLPQHVDIAAARPVVVDSVAAAMQVAAAVTAVVDTGNLEASASLPQISAEHLSKARSRKRTGFVFVRRIIGGARSDPAFCC